MHQWEKVRTPICVSEYLRICAPTKSHKKQEIIIEHHLKTMINVWYLRICVFSKEITALEAKFGDSIARGMLCHPSEIIY
jgi:hypothetical protein